MNAPKPRELAAHILPATYLTSADLARHGVTRHHQTRLVHEGRLLRARKDRYLTADLARCLTTAAELGGRLDCISLLAALGVYVLDGTPLHLQIEKGASRLPPRSGDVVAHWRRSSQPRTALAADLVEALAQAVRCQPVRDALATLDSAWHHRLVDETGIDAVFALLPRRYRRLRALLDKRAESGPETILRLMLRGLGCEVQVQVVIPGVGRVDLVVDGWLIVECDSKAHHEGWAAQKKDRRRDLAAARLGFSTVRPLAEDVLYRRDEALLAMKETLSHRPTHLRNSSDSARGRATRR